ncbi:MAG: putative Ig domain-containing protein [Armatimonadota bacterium]
MHVSCLILLVASTAWADDESPFVVVGPKTHSEIITTARREYTIVLGGTVDMDNTTTRGCGSYEVAFQPNISLEIENVGTTPVVDPWIVINGVRDWRTIDTMLSEALRGARDDQEKVYFIYEFARSHRYHDSPLFVHNELHDPVKYFNCYGAGLCDDMGSVTSALAYRAGFTKARHGGDPVNRAMHGHVMCEIPVNGHYEFIDTDENAFYLDPDNERPVSGDEIVRDSDLARREYAYGPIFSSWQQGEKASALLGRDDGQYRSIVIGHEMHLTLRPGERLTYRWDNVGKCPGKGTLKFFGNSALDYAVPLTPEGLGEAQSSESVSARDASLTGDDADAAVVYEVRSPYVICGGRVAAQFLTANAGDAVGVDVSTDGEKWTQVWEKMGAGPWKCDVALDDALQVKRTKAHYSYLVRIRLRSADEGSAALTGLRIHTDVLASPIALPRLSLGRNRVVYTDRTQGPRRIKITHTYQESGNIKPPPAPGLTYPEAGATVRDSVLRFKWERVEGASKYHLRVSRRRDMLTSYRPSLDVVVDGPPFGNPRTGIFSPDETYYWRVRARDANGVWGAWSPVRRFSWEGPCPPVDLEYEERGDKGWLTWKPSPRGTRPVRYEVYASDDRGFMPSKEPYTVYTRGQQPPNLVAETSRTEMLILSDDPADGAPNKSSYRVIAVDANGTRSGTSWPLELPHPCVYSRPVTRAKVGQPYRYRVLTIRCNGDLQYRYQKPGYGFWEREGYVFELTQGPKWLHVNGDTGVLEGTPGPGDVGEASVTVTVRRTWPDEVKKDQYRPEYFLKDAARFQAEARQSFTITVAD